MIDLTLLGTVRISRSTGDMVLVAQQPKRLALLAYLAAAHPRGAHRRDALVALLWPELDQDRARSALRQALHAIRRSLGVDAISSEGTELVGLRASEFRCDLWTLEAAAARGDHAAALQAYKGELLHGLHVTDAPEFENWLDGERSRVRAAARTSAWAEAERNGEDASAESLVRFALSLSDYDEAALRRAMELLARAGRRATALAVYENFADRLQRELELEPSGETRALVAELRRAEPIAPLPLRHSPLVASRVTTIPVVRVRRSTRQWGVAAAAAVVTLAATASLAPSRDALLDPRLIRVESFTTIGPNANLDTVARFASSDAREALTALDNVHVAASSATDNPVDIGAGTIVRGFVRSVGDSIELRAEVVEVRTDVILRTVSVRGLSGAAYGPMIATFNDALRAAVATALYPGWGTALSHPLSYDSYRLFVDGMRSIKLEQHDSAVAAFERAYAGDSTFTAAAILVAMERYQLGQLGVADSMARRIAPRRARLRPVDAKLCDWIVRSLAGDRIGARSAMEAVTVLAPTAELAWLQLAVDNVETARPRQALAALDKIDPASDFGEGWTSYWATRLEALHLLGDHQRELVVARTALGRHPDLAILTNYELRALAALGRFEEMEQGIRRIEAVPAGRGVDVPTTMRQVALELRAHGHDSVSSPLLARVRAWYAARPESERATVAWQSGYARTLYLTDDRAAASAMYDSLLRAHPTCLDCVGAIGVLAARGRDRATVDRCTATLAAASRPYLFGRNLMWQSRIAAALGERERAANLLSSAFSAGSEFDVMTHADFELSRIDPNAVYRRFARLEHSH